LSETIGDNLAANDIPAKHERHHYASLQPSVRHLTPNPPAGVCLTGDTATHDSPTRECPPPIQLPSQEYSCGSALLPCRYDRSPRLRATWPTLCLRPPPPFAPN